MTICRRCVISGRVQGVWFRASTRQQAKQLGLSGYAHNLPNGQVEVLACGEEGALQTLQKWLWQGPEKAQVKDVYCESVVLTELPQGFD